MIRIARDGEPPQLKLVREQKLIEARKAQLLGQDVDRDGYDIVKQELFAMQRRMCCYSEKLEEQAKYRDVEHYRPKSLYWWLTWTRENLLFACIDCNREQKRNQFPLEHGSVSLVAEQAPPGAEQPLVIDPSDPSVDPTTEIVFQRERIHGNERWVPRGTSARGRKTIEVCGLDRPGLLDLYRDHVDNTVRPRLVPFFTADRAGDARAAFDTWETARSALLRRERAFRALSHDALNVLVPAKHRARYHLTLERPAP